MSLDPEGEYRNHVTATIDNWTGFEGGSHSLELYAPVGMTVLVDTLDEQATLSDSFPCPAGFACGVPWTNLSVNGSVTLTYTVSVTNKSAFCGDFEIRNSVSLVPEDSSNAVNDNVSIAVDSGDCGCTETIGHWEAQPELIISLLPQYLGTMGGAETLVVNTLDIAIEILDQNVHGSRSNGITRLYAQLLSAKLAIQNGADPTVIASTILAVDIFLATHDYSEWTRLSPAEQASVSEWQAALADYNIGLTGPGHCLL